MKGAITCVRCYECGGSIITMPGLRRWCRCGLTFAERGGEGDMAWLSYGGPGWPAVEFVELPEIRSS